MDSERVMRDLNYVYFELQDIANAWRMASDTEFAAGLACGYDEAAFLLKHLIDHYAVTESNHCTPAK